MKKQALDLYLKTKKAKNFPGKSEITDLAKDKILEDAPEINKEFLSHAEKLHELILDQHIPEHLREHLLEHLQDIEEILGAHEDLPHEDNDYDNTGYDAGGLSGDDKDPDEKTPEMQKSFLFKATTMPEEQAQDLQKAPFRPHYEGIESKELAPGLFMHSSKKKTAMGNMSILHHISSSEDPHDKNSQLAQGSLLHFEGDKHEFPSISSVKTKPGLEGKGLGKLLYQSMIKQHGGIMSDTVMSEADQRVWKSLGKHPAFDIKHAPEGNADHTEGRHVLKVKQDFEPEIPNFFVKPQENLRHAQVINRNQAPERQPSLREAQQLPTIKKEFSEPEVTQATAKPQENLRHAQVINRNQAPERQPSFREAQQLPTIKKES